MCSQLQPNIQLKTQRMSFISSRHRGRHVRHRLINCFCHSHKQFSCPLNSLPCYLSFSKRRIPQEWQMRRRRKEQHEKGFLVASPNTHTENMLLFSLTLLLVVRQDWMTAVTYRGTMMRDEDEWWSRLKDKSSPSLSVLLPPPCLSFLQPVTEQFLDSFFPSFIPLKSHVMGSCVESVVMAGVRWEGRQAAWKDAGLLWGDVWLCNSTFEICDYKQDNFFNFLFCLDSAAWQSAPAAEPFNQSHR